MGPQVGRHRQIQWAIVDPPPKKNMHKYLDCFLARIFIGHLSNQIRLPFFGDTVVVTTLIVMIRITHFCVNGVEISFYRQFIAEPHAMCVTLHRKCRRLYISNESVIPLVHLFHFLSHIKLVQSCLTKIKHNRLSHQDLVPAKNWQICKVQLGS